METGYCFPNGGKRREDEKLRGLARPNLYTKYFVIDRTVDMSRCIAFYVSNLSLYQSRGVIDYFILFLPLERSQVIKQYVYAETWRLSLLVADKMVTVVEIWIKVSCKEQDEYTGKFYSLHLIHTSLIWNINLKVSDKSNASQTKVIIRISVILLVVLVLALCKQIQTYFLVQNTDQKM